MFASLRGPVKGFRFRRALIDAAAMHDDGTDEGALLAAILRDAERIYGHLGNPRTIAEFLDRRQAVIDAAGMGVCA